MLTLSPDTNNAPPGYPESAFILLLTIYYLLLTIHKPFIHSLGSPSSITHG